MSTLGDIVREHEQIKRLKEKEQKYDELQKWFWWLERRTHEGKTAKANIETFLKGIKEYFEPFENE